MNIIRQKKKGEFIRMMLKKVIVSVLVGFVVLFVFLSQLLVSARGVQEGMMRLDLKEKVLEVSVSDSDAERIEKILSNIEYEVMLIVVELDTEKAKIISDFLIYHDGDLTIMVDNIRSGGECRVVAIYQDLKMTNRFRLVTRNQ